MSEDDRAAKAARAKALLKKRQQKKAAETSAAGSSVASPVSPPRTFSPAPSEHPEVNGRDLGDVFSKDTSDTSWLTSLPRVASPPPPQPPHATVTTPPHVAGISRPAAAGSAESPPHRSTSISATKPLQDKIESLSKENADLVAEVNRLQSYETAAQQALASLEAERSRVEKLQESYQSLQDDTEIALQNERQTVSLLVTEKTHLSAELQKRESFESRTQEVEDLLERERSKSDNLNEQIRRLQTEVQENFERARQSEAKEKALSERFKDQERQLQLSTAAASESRKVAENANRKLRDLEEQIQSDDRVERLENSLKHTQDRADELEFALSKLKQVHLSLKTERDELESSHQKYVADEEQRGVKVSQLQSQLSEAEEQLSIVSKERTELAQANSKLQQLVNTHESSVKELQEKLLQAASAMATHTRQLQMVQTELKNALRRAEDAETIQKNLQAEGTNLMRSLEEMRPKIVELTGAKLEYAEKVESLEHTIRKRDSVIAQLESDLDEARDSNEISEQAWKEKLAQQVKQHTEAQSRSSDLQKAYAELQEELDTALVSLRSVESQRTNQHQEASRRLEEYERISTLSHTQDEELRGLRQELEARRKANDEEQDFLDRAQNEIETLRAEIEARDNEIEHLRETVNSPARSDAPHSLDDELLSSMRQQHALELSNATSQVRALENTIFDLESANHALQKQINALEEQLSQVRRNAQRSFSPMPSRPASRAYDSDLRRSSIGSHRPNPPPLSRSIFEHSMTPETLHKRKVSLSMLKARIDSEVKAGSGSSQPPSRTLSPVHSESHSHHSSPLVAHHIHRPQFLDESHVFWCNSCHGDLVIL